MASPYGDSRNMSAALGSAQQNFNSNQQQIAQATQPTQATGVNPQDIMTPTQIFQAHQRKLGVEEQTSNALAHAMTQKQAIATKGAVTSAAQAAQHAEQLKRLGSVKIQAKHPLDILAIGIQGWKMKRKDKEMLASTAQAAQDAQDLVLATEQKEKAQKNAEWARREQMKAPPKTAMADATVQYREEQQQGIPYEKMTPMARMGYNAEQDRRKALKDQGTGGAVEMPAAVKGKKLGNIYATDQGKRQMIKGVDKYDPDYFGGTGLAKGLFGNAMDFFGQGGEATEFSADQRVFRAGMYNFANKLIKERSGAAVTKQEFDRFMKEYPINPMLGQRNFEEAMDAYVNQMSEDVYTNMRDGGWKRNRKGQLVEDEGAEPLIDGGDPSSDEYWADFNAANENLPPELYNEEGDFHGYTQRGNTLRAEREGQSSGDRTATQRNAPVADTPTQQAQAALEANKGNPEETQKIIDMAAKLGIKLDELK